MITVSWERVFVVVFVVLILLAAILALFRKKQFIDEISRTLGDEKQKKTEEDP
jgi:hypothetical protein